MDDVDGFREALMALKQAQKTCTHDVFVEAFSRSEAQSEPVLAEESQRGRGLGNDGWMIAHARARHGRHQTEAFGGMDRGTQD